VRDTGIGIPAAELPRVFDMFAQAHRAVGRGQGGLGIGLTMVHSLVEMHHGTVEARSAGSGAGQRIHRAPAAGGRRTPPQIAGPARPARRGRRRRWTASASWWWTTTATPPTRSACCWNPTAPRCAWSTMDAAHLAVADSFLPTSVLLDLGMPGMDGYEVARRLRQDERFATVQHRGADRLGPGRRPAPDPQPRLLPPSHQAGRTWRTLHAILG
jgi:CheY-like chemotaxis protein